MRSGNSGGKLQQCVGQSRHLTNLFRGLNQSSFAFAGPQDKNPWNDIYMSVLFIGLESLGRRMSIMTNETSS